MMRMPLRGRAAIAIAVALVALTAGCGLTRKPSPGPSAVAGGELPRGSESVTLDPADFSTTIDNPYWPMEPGTRWTYRETDQDGEELRVVVTVTDDTKAIANGITARVVRDTVYRGEEIVEDTFDWYAQDSSGTVWYLGEQTEEFDGGRSVSTEGSFEAGVDGALPGVVMPAAPVPGMSYRQEYLAGEAEDNGEVLRVGEIAATPFGQFDDVVVTRDTSTIEPDVVEYKFYANGIGPVLALGVSGGGGREELLSVEEVPAGTATGPLGRPD